MFTIQIRQLFISCIKKLFLNARRLMSPLVRSVDPVLAPLRANTAFKITEIKWGPSSCKRQPKMPSVSNRLRAMVAKWSSIVVHLENTVVLAKYQTINHKCMDFFQTFSWLSWNKGSRILFSLFYEINQDDQVWAFHLRGCFLVM